MELAATRGQLSPGGAPDPGSFRDPDSRVFAADGLVLRALTRRGLDDWEQLRKTSFFHRHTEEGSLIRTERAPWAEADLPPEWVAVLSHERIPFVSYPYEWPFSMLRAAALLQLDLVVAAAAEGMALKDGTPYNIQWKGHRPVFIDTGSFEPLTGLWPGYRQFCGLFLYPLMLQALKGIPFNPWLRGSLEGISPAEFARLLSLRDRLRRGVWTHVILHRYLERRHATGDDSVAADLRSSALGPELVARTARRLRRVVERLEARRVDSAWSGYASSSPYSPADLAAKDAFVARAVALRRPRLVWDLGCNDGRFARIAARSGPFVVAMDADATVVDDLYSSLTDDEGGRILPLVVDLADPSPGRGWRSRERRPLLDRGAPDLVLCLALLHHLAISRNIPVTALVDWLASLGGSIVVEFPTRDDAMVRRLLRGKPPGANPDYELSVFEAALAGRFQIEAREPLSSGTRVLFSARLR